MAKNLNFLTGSPSTRLTNTSDANYVSIKPGSVYFTSDGKIYFDLDSDTRLWMGEIANHAATAERFLAAKTIKLTGDVTGEAAGGADGGWSISTEVKDDSHSHSNYLPINGSKAMTGKLSLVANANTDALTSGALDLKSSNIQSVNAIYMNMASTQKGISFIRDTTNSTVDTIYAANGVLYFVPNRTIGSAGTGHVVLHSNNYGDYTVTKGGVGATGTWAISISGTAAVATALASKSIGGAGVPVYIDANGKPVECTTLSLNTTGNAATATKLSTTKKINGTDFNGSADITTANWGPQTSFQISDGTNKGTAAASTGGGTVTLKLPATIKATLSGTADKAKALVVSAAVGSSTVPVYINDSGKPVACTSISLDVTGKAATAGTADKLKGFNLTIGNLMQAITGEAAAVYSLASIGAVAKSGDEISGDLTIDPDNGSFIGNLTGKASSAGTADKLGTNAGTNQKPVYFANGVPVACADTLGVNITGTASALTTSVGTGVELLSFVGGKPTLSTSDIGSNKQLIYVEDGAVKASTIDIGGTAQPVYVVDGVLTKLSATKGSASKPVYLNAGVITACGDTLAVNISGVAASATKWAAPITMTIGSTGKTVDGSTTASWNYAEITGIGGATGIAPLVNNLIPSQYLPAYVDDVVEGYLRDDGKFYADETTTDPMAAMGGLLYVNLTDKKVYRWSGSAYVVISETVAIGTTTGTALDGATGMTHINDKQNPHQTTYSQVQALGTVTTTAQTVASAVTFNGKITASGGIAGNLTGNVTGDVTGSVSGNAGSATKLKTARKINGTDFNGTGAITTALWGTERTITVGLTGKSVNGSTNVSWSLAEIGAVPAAGGTMTGDLTLSAANEDRYINFNYTGGTGYDWRIGYLGSGSGDANYLVIQSDSTDGTYVNALRFGLTSLDAAFGGNVQPLVTNTKTLGTTDYKWKNVYATTFTGALSGNATTATTLQHSRTINGTNFDGSASITTANWGTSRNIYIADSSAAHTGDAVSVNGGADITLKLPATITAALVGNASTATKLKTARTINGTSFNGSANITTASWGTARTITIGATGKSIDGSANVSWTLAEIDSNLSTVTTYTKSISLTAGWQDVFTANNATSYLAANGTYVVQVYINDASSSDGLSHYHEYYSGIMSWYKDGTNSSDVDEIILHKAGHASSAHNIYLRTKRNSSGYLALQVAADAADANTSTEQSLVFKFRRLI